MNAISSFMSRLEDAGYSAPTKSFANDGEIFLSWRRGDAVAVAGFPDDGHIVVYARSSERGQAVEIDAPYGDDVDLTSFFHIVGACNP